MQTAVSWVCHGRALYIYVDCQLPFGLTTAPAIFNAIAEALEWILRSGGVCHVIHYLDDFLLLGHPNSDECATALRTTLATCRELGVLLAADKVEGPATLLTFLGIELNTMTMSLGLPADKLASLCDFYSLESRVSLPIQITQELTGLLLSPPHSWTSPLWRQLCGNFWKRV